MIGGSLLDGVWCGCYIHYEYYLRSPRLGRRAFGPLEVSSFKAELDHDHHHHINFLLQTLGAGDLGCNPCARARLFKLYTTVLGRVSGDFIRPLGS